MLMYTVMLQIVAKVDPLLHATNENATANSLLCNVCQECFYPEALP